MLPTLERSAGIHVQRLRKTYRRRGRQLVTAVDDVDLSIPEGEIVVLLGQSGCGKTTLLRCVAGLEIADSGRIELSGRTVFGPNVDIPPERRDVTMMFQNYGIWPHMTVAANVGFPLSVANVPASEIARRVAEVLNALGLGHLGAEYPSHLSGGQQQRVALARCLVVRPRIILFDEPLSNVDAKIRDELRLELLRLHREFRFTGLYVTHDQQEAMKLADRLAVMLDGKIVQIGKPDEVYRRPRHPYVAEFIGTTNLLDGKVVEVSGGSVVLETAAGTLRAAAVAASGDCSIGQSVRVILRPESMKIDTQERSGGDEINVLRGQIVRRMFAGAHSEVLVAIGRESLQLWCPTAELLSLETDEIVLRVKEDELWIMSA